VIRTLSADSFRRLQLKLGHSFILLFKEKADKRKF